MNKCGTSSFFSDYYHYLLPSIDSKHREYKFFHRKLRKENQKLSNDGTVYRHMLDLLHNLKHKLSHIPAINTIVALTFRRRAHRNGWC